MRFYGNKGLGSDICCMSLSKKYYKVEEYLADLPSQYQHRFMIVRDLIMSSHPDIQEKISYNLPFYFYKGFFLYLGIYKKKDFVLAFCRGAHLADEAGVLRADAKQEHMRHWVLSTLEEPNYELIAQYLGQALLINDKFALKK